MYSTKRSKLILLQLHFYYHFKTLEFKTCLIVYKSNFGAEISFWTPNICYGFFPCPISWFSEEFCGVETPIFTPNIFIDFLFEIVSRYGPGLQLGMFDMICPIVLYSHSFQTV
uniref:Uncharacterized protein n=1 Tax=Cacopsylla melanoneura TaxID=428564 RepID=A0A8D8M902_9HEMI